MKFERGDITATPVNTIEKLKKRYNLEGEAKVESATIDINTLADELMPIFLDFYYPIGSIYTSTDSTDPSDLFGGTWTQIKDTFLLSAGDNYTAGDTGGEATHTLTTDEMPSHNHAYYGFFISASVQGSGRALALDNQRQWTQTDNAIQSAGSGNAHNNMPPYLVVYVWERIS